MSADEILAALVKRFPGLLPQSAEDINGADLTQELTILVGSWRRVDEFQWRWARERER